MKKFLTTLFLVFSFFYTEAFGAENVTTSTPEWTAYVNEVETTIKSNWKPPIDQLFVKVVTAIKIEKNGEVSAIEIMGKSKNTPAEKAALAAINKSSPFKALPQGYEGESAVINFTFDLKAMSEPADCILLLDAKPVKKTAGALTEEERKAYAEYLVKIRKPISEIGMKYNKQGRYWGTFRFNIKKDGTVTNIVALGATTSAKFNKDTTKALSELNLPPFDEAMGSIDHIFVRYQTGVKP